MQSIPNEAPQKTLSQPNKQKQSSTKPTGSVQPWKSDTTSASEATSSADHDSAMWTSQTHSPGSSIRTGSVSVASSSQPLVEDQRRSSIGKIMDKARAKMSGSERLPSREKDFERERQKEVEKQRRKEEYERLGLGDRTRFGIPGAGQWNA